MENNFLINRNEIYSPNTMIDRIQSIEFKCQTNQIYRFDWNHRKKGATFISDRKWNRGRFDLDEIFCLYEHTLRKGYFLVTLVYRETRES